MALLAADSRSVFAKVQVFDRCYRNNSRVNSPQIMFSRKLSCEANRQHCLANFDMVYFVEQY